VAEATRRVIGEYGANHVDLNMGCPAPKVTRLGGGAALPVRQVLFRNIVTAAVQAAGDVPVTVKMRMGLDDDTLTYLASGRAAADAGAAAIALHARTAEQHYAGYADWSAIAALKAAVTTVPVLGNGDIWEAGDAVRMVEQTGCDGVVVGRGCLGRPWLFRDLASAFAGEPIAPAPLLGEVAAIMRRHARMLVDSKQSEQIGMRDFRKHTGWYMTGYPVGSERRRELAQVSTLSELARVLARIDPLIELPPGGERLTRGHTSGPRAVVVPDGWRESFADPRPPVGADVVTSGG
jgi:nifR3 family TIM-barrel protein